MSNLQTARELLYMACASVELQANWDKKPYSLWYYKAKEFLKKKKHRVHSKNWNEEEVYKTIGCLHVTIEHLEEQLGLAKIEIRQLSDNKQYLQQHL